MRTRGGSSGVSSSSSSSSSLLKAARSKAMAMKQLLAMQVCLDQQCHATNTHKQPLMCTCCHCQAWHFFRPSICFGQPLFLTFNVASAESSRPRNKGSKPRRREPKAVREQQAAAAAAAESISAENSSTTEGSASQERRPPPARQTASFAPDLSALPVCHLDVLTIVCPTCNKHALCPY